jgi:hypothetical protein
MRDRIMGIGMGVALCALVAGVAAWAGQPQMQSALARDALERATSNKGGHRQNALDLVNRAIAQVEKGIEYAKEH